MVPECELIVLVQAGHLVLTVNFHARRLLQEVVVESSGLQQHFVGTVLHRVVPPDALRILDAGAVQKASLPLRLGE